MDSKAIRVSKARTNWSTRQPGCTRCTRTNWSTRQPGFQGAAAPSLQTYVDVYRASATAISFLLSPLTVTIPLTTLGVNAATAGAWAISGNGIQVPVAGTYLVTHTTWINFADGVARTICTALALNGTNLPATQAIISAGDHADTHQLGMTLTLTLAVNDVLTIVGRSGSVVTAVSTVVNANGLFGTPTRAASIALSRIA